MKKTLYFLLATILTGVCYTGCKEKPVTTPGDLEDPTIIMSSPQVVPLGEYVYTKSTDSFDVDIRFEDDFDLEEYEITLRYHPEHYYLKTANDPWKETWFGKLDGLVGGTNFRVHVVWNPSAGPYEFTVKCTDASGKSAEVTTYLYVKNHQDTLLPYFEYQTPDTVNVDTFAIGQNIPIMGQCLDPGGNVASWYLRVRDAFTDEILENSEIALDSVFLNPAPIDTFVNVQAGTVPGDYNVEVYPKDQFNNVGRTVAKIYIKTN